MRLGLVVALPMEARGWTVARARTGDVLPLQDGGLVSVCGVGGVRAAAAAERLAASGVQALVAWGTAGGLDPTLGTGAVLLPDEVADEAGERWAADPALRARLRAALVELRLADEAGLLVASAGVVAEVLAKAELFRRTGARAVDMESAAVARVAAGRGLPFAALRALSDDARTPVPRAARVALDAAGRLRPGALLGVLARDPGQLAGLLRLRAGLHAASRALERAARHLAASALPPLPEERSGAP